MEINVQKSEAFVMNGTGRIKHSQDVKLNNVPLEWVTRLKYPEAG